MRPYQKWTLLGLALGNILVFLSLGASVLRENSRSELIAVVTATPALPPRKTPELVPPTILLPTPTPLGEPVGSILLSPRLPEAGSDFESQRIPLGQSVEGRSITSFAFPSSQAGAAALVLVCGIHGDEMNAWPILESLVSDLYTQTFQPPANLSLYFIQSLNPDGTAHNNRLNAHGIDLNRNWDTFDWKTRVEVGSFEYLAHGGGTQPFSEPETQIMRDFLLDLNASHPGGVTVIYFHAAFPPRGLVLPGQHRVNGEDMADTPSRELGMLLAETTDFNYSNVWAGNYTVTGDATSWAVAQGLRALTVELPVRTALEPEAALSLRDGVLTVIDTIADQ